MKIAHLIPHFFGTVGGLQVCVHNICERHVQKGHEVYVFTKGPIPGGFKSSYHVGLIFPFRFLSVNYRVSSFFLSRYFGRLQKRHGFDLWQINGGFPYGVHLADFFRKRKIPTVLRCSGDDIQIDKAYGYGVRRDPRINKIIERNYCKFSACVAITKTVSAEYRAMKIPQDRIWPIPNGVSTDRFGKAVGGNGVRQELGIGRDAVVILSVGRNHPKKQYYLIPRMLRKLLYKGINAYWIVIGKGATQINGQAELGRDHSRLIRIEEISFTHNRYKIPSDKLLEYYHAVDIFAMTSALETFGIVLVEAMSAGLPIVCFDVPGVRDVMHPDCGVMCPSGDIDGFARGLARLATDADRSRTAQNCMNYAGQYSWRRIADQYENMYQSLLGE